MLSFLPAPVIGVLASLLLFLNILFCASLLLGFAVIKLVLPFKPVRIVIDRLLNFFAENWVSGNSGWMRLTQPMNWTVRGADQLQYHGWYLVNSNHQSWVDIFVLQHIFGRRIPLLKFFLKRELIWVPIMGLAWWALDFPFMRRHSEAYLQKHPDQRGKDLETTRKACEKFALIPTSVMNFLEGTRYTSAKHQRQQSPYQHLLKPKAGGIALALNAMGDKFQSFLNVTIVYPDGIPTFWGFLCGKMGRVVVEVETLPIPMHFVGKDYQNDPTFKTDIQQWVHELWLEKDALIGRLLAESRS
ncbi:1-acyl-sn-glycerol-3-phosphate acyltransferase [Chitinivorax tropicus]|uniref:1-acyl-sn-glycerol-3-phosphate acyltransferase n=1 Tax=Chitinivorax tropicus TaxID=714531 RepID=A0A840MR61_9PROT|nr:acyltransferase [Chitinivorax tropicus]MBB5019272.1 1-acyl-sn-glycerol-3-phosphate acyltransferase [Chitinivorax tropicus]